MKIPRRNPFYNGALYAHLYVLCNIVYTANTQRIRYLKPIVWFFNLDVVLARLEADFSDERPSIPAAPNHQVSLQCSTNEYPCNASRMSPTAKYPCSAQPPSIPAVPNRRVSLQCPTAEYPCSAEPQNILTLPSRKVSLQCSTTKYPRSAQLQSIPAVPSCRVSLQCPTTKYPCRAQPKRIPAVPNRRVSLECPTAEYEYSCSAFAVLKGRQLREKVTLLVQ